MARGTQRVCGPIVIPVAFKKRNPRYAAIYLGIPNGRFGHVAITHVHGGEESIRPERTTLGLRINLYSKTIF